MQKAHRRQLGVVSVKGALERGVEGAGVLFSLVTTVTSFSRK